MLIPLDSYRPIGRPKLAEPLRSLIVSLHPQYVVTLPDGIYLGYLPPAENRSNNRYYECALRHYAGGLTQLPVFVRGAFRRHAVWMVDELDQWHYVGHVRADSVPLRVPDLSGHQPVHCAGDRAQAVAVDQHGKLLVLDYEPLEMYGVTVGLALRIPEDWLPAEPTIASTEQLLDGLPKRWILLPPQAKLYAVGDAHYVCLERHGLEMVIPYVAREDYWDVLFWWRSALRMAQRAVERLRVYVECRTPIRFADHPRLWFDAVWLRPLPKELRLELGGDDEIPYSAVVEASDGLSGLWVRGKSKVSNQLNAYEPSIVPVIRYDRDLRRVGTAEWHRFASSADPAIAQVSLPLSEYLAEWRGSMMYVPVLTSEDSLMELRCTDQFGWLTYVLHALFTDETSIAWCLPTTIRLNLTPVDYNYAVVVSDRARSGCGEAVVAGKRLLTNRMDIYPLLMKRGRDPYWLLSMGHTPRLLTANGHRAR